MTKGWGVNPRRKKAASRVTEFMNGPVRKFQHQELEFENSAMVFADSDHSRLLKSKSALSEILIISRILGW